MGERYAMGMAHAGKHPPFFINSQHCGQGILESQGWVGGDWGQRIGLTHKNRNKKPRKSGHMFLATLLKTEWDHKENRGGRDGR